MNTLQTIHMSQADLENFLTYCANRAKYLHGHLLVKGANGETQLASLSTELPKFFTDLLAGTKDPEKIRQRSEFLQRAAADPKTRMQMCALRNETFNNFIFATHNIIDFFFDIVTLKIDERPKEQNTTKREVKVYYNGPEGTAKSVFIEPDDEHALKNLHFLSTDKVRYKKFDIYNGSLVDAALQTITLAYDWNNKAEGLAMTILQTGFGVFTFTGKKSSYVFNANSRINASNLPDTNDLEIASVGANTHLDFPVYDKIIGYCAKLAGSNPGAELRPTGRILTPGSDLETYGASVKADGGTGTVPAEKILQDGWVGVRYKGINWVHVPDNTLAPGTCYPELSIKPARMFTKPSLDQEKIITNEKLEQENEEERYMRKVIGFSLNTTQRKNMCRVKYRTT